MIIKFLALKITWMTPFSIQSLDRYHARGLLYFGIWLHHVTPMRKPSKSTPCGLFKLQRLPKLGPWKGLCMFIWPWGACQQNSLPEQKMNFSQEKLNNIANWGLLRSQEGKDLPTSASRWNVCKVDTWKRPRAHAVLLDCLFFFLNGVYSCCTLGL